MLYIILHTYDKDPETLLWSGVSYLWARQVSQILLCTDKSQGLCSKSQIPRSLRFEVRRVHGQHRLEGDNARNTTLSLSLSLLSLSLYKYAPQKALLCRNKQFNGLVVLPKAWQMNNPAQLSYARHPGAVLKGACAFNFASRTFLRTFLPGINLYTSMGWWVWSGKRLKPPFSVCSLSWPLSFLKWQSSTFAHAVILLVARVLTVTIRIAQGSNSYTLWAFAQTASCSTAPK